MEACSLYSSSPNSSFKFNWVLKISKKEMLICVFCFFQLGIFVCFRRIHSRMEATFSFDFKDVFSH